MSALSKIQEAGFKVFIDHGNLGIVPAKNLTVAQCEFLKSHKAEIIGELQYSLSVTCWTPAGKPLETIARDQEHLEQLRRWNPEPKNLN